MAALQRYLPALEKKAAAPLKRGVVELKKLAAPEKKDVELKRKAAAQLKKVAAPLKKAAALQRSNLITASSVDMS
ncbi:MAG: hypothetical protein H7252_02120 [Cytophaga sp.]|nr:hypothetical protein [Undibacterium sp.]